MKLSASKRIQLLSAFVALALVAGVVAGALSMERAAASPPVQRSVNVTFTKWVNGYPNMIGTVGGDAGTGTFSGEILSRDPTIANGQIVEIEALYHFNGGAHSFNARVNVVQFSNKVAFIGGTVIDGSLQGSSIDGMYRLIPCDQAPSKTCFQGTLHITGD